MFWYNINAKEDYINIAWVASGNKLPSGKALKKKWFYYQVFGCSTTNFGPFLKRIKQANFTVQTDARKAKTKNKLKKTHWC